MKYCKYLDKFFGTCHLYQEEYDTYEGIEYKDCKCRDIKDCDYKISLKEYRNKL
jgi:hypothetical protein